MSSFDGVFTFGLLLRSVGAFAGLMLIHVLVWRVLEVRKQIVWLFAIFLGVPTLAFLVGLARSSAPVELGALVSRDIHRVVLLHPLLPGRPDREPDPGHGEIPR